MIGIDTNVLVRFLVQDDPEQSRRATEAMGRVSAQEPAFLSTVVLIEMYWVLTRAYRNSAEDVISTLVDLISSDGVVIQDEEHVRRALDLASSGGGDFPDALIEAACKAHGCLSVLSFDHHAIRTLGFVLP